MIGVLGGTFMDFTIENEFLRVSVASLGAELTSVIKKETGEEMLWQADPAVWNRHAPMLFPYCGKLKDGKYTHNGVTYEGGQHGFARDMEHSLIAQQPDSVSLCLEANALTMEKFPFAFKLISTFTLIGKTLAQHIEIVNDGDVPMQFGFGFHPGVNCPFDENHKADDYAFVFDTSETPDVVDVNTANGLVTGKTYKYFENGTEIPISDTLFAHDSICFKGLKSQTLSVVEKNTGRKVIFDIAGFPYTLVWSAAGKLHFVCVEPWFGLPDFEDASGNWSEKRASLTLGAEQSWQTELRMTFER